MPVGEPHTTFDLIQRAQHGDGAALDELMRCHLATLRAFVRAKCGPELRLREADSDLVQTVCREALGSLQDYRWQGEGSFRLWLCTLALNKLRNKHDYHRAQRRDVKREAKEGDGYDGVAAAYRTVGTPSQHAVARELVERVEAAMDRIEPEARDLIVLTRVVGLSHREVAAKLGKSEEASRTALRRALVRLAAAMQAVERERKGGATTPPPTSG